MWAPADLFSGAVNMVTLPMRHGVTFFYERPFALALLFLGLGSVIAIVEAIKR